MSNSSLISSTWISGNSNNPRNQPISVITPHHMAGNLSPTQYHNTTISRRNSANYAIYNDGSIELVVEEKNRSWCSSSPENDHKAITIEIANSAATSDWPISTEAWNSLVKLCVDICQRNGIAKLNFTGNSNGNLTMHKYFTATACPGPYLSAKFPELASTVNAQLQGGSPTPEPEPTPEPAPEVLYCVQLGAFEEKENADKRAANLKDHGFETYVHYYEGLYHVQVGAFSTSEAAEKYAQQFQEKGYETYVTVKRNDSSPTPAPAPEVSALKIGDLVKVNEGAKTYEGNGVFSYVYTKTYPIDELKGDRAVLDLTGLCTAFNVADLTRA